MIRAKGRTHILRRKLTLTDIFTFEGTVRIPVSESIPLAKEARQIIDTSAFQRLRGVRQLGPAHFVYPGAIHTRFEHSLGTYALSLEFVDRLLKRPAFYSFSEDPGDMARLLVASALLHDIGHYPFSHLIEEIGVLPQVSLKRHEKRAEQIIMNSEIRHILERRWRLNPRDVCNVIDGTGLQGGFAVMASALSSVLDLDKMDYLIRDSVHCGVNFGFALDKNRFLAGLQIDTENSRICLSTKAESYIPAIITVRNLMYYEVYWHKTVRAAGAMIKVLIYQLCKHRRLDSVTLRAMLQSQDDRVAFDLEKITKRLKNRALHALAAPFVFSNRGLFKMVYSFGTSAANAKPSAASFLKDILDEDNGSSFAICLRKAKRLEKAIRKRLPLIRSGDILIEGTPVRKGHDTFELVQMRLLNERTGELVQPSYDINGADKLLGNSRRIFVFCHPERAKVFEKRGNLFWEKIFHDAAREQSSKQRSKIVRRKTLAANEMNLVRRPSNSAKRS